jgi:hypothetical protein
MEGLKMDIRKRIQEVLYDMSETELIFDVYNEWCSKNNYHDDRIDNICDIDEFLGECSFTEALKQIDTDNFDLSDDYIMCTIYGYKSLDDDEAFEVVEDNISDIIDYIIENDEDFGNDGIRDILDEANEAEDD